MEDMQFFREMIPNYAFALKNMLWEHEGFQEPDSMPDLKRESHLPNQIAAAMYQRLNKMYREDGISSTQLWMLNEDCKALTNLCGANERIKNTPIPYTYSVFIKKFVFLYGITLPFGWVISLGYFIIPVVILSCTPSWASLELFAEEIENPFGTDDNDLL